MAYFFSNGKGIVALRFNTDSRQREADDKRKLEETKKEDKQNGDQQV
jgi:hypothetical protein